MVDVRKLILDLPYELVAEDDVSMFQFYGAAQSLWTEYQEVTKNRPRIFLARKRGNLEECRYVWESEYNDEYTGVRWYRVVGSRSLFLSSVDYVLDEPPGEIFVDIIDSLIEGKRTNHE